MVIIIQSVVQMPEYTFKRACMVTLWSICDAQAVIRYNITLLIVGLLYTAALNITMQHQGLLLASLYNTWWS